MPPRKDLNADKSGSSSSSSSSSGSAGNNNTTTNSSTTTTNTATTSDNTSAATATVPTSTSTTASTSSAQFVVPPASVTTTRSSTSALAAAAAACVNNGTNSAGGEDNRVPGVEPATESRTMAYQANAKLCRLVRKCPWMYDRTHHNYAKKHILDKSWVKIARECNDSVPSCKERWRNIRAAFARSINIYKTHSGPNRVKPYYLHKELSFLVKPMMEGRVKLDDTAETSEGGIKEDYTECEDEDEEQDIVDEPLPTEEEDDFNDESAEVKSTFQDSNTEISNQSATKFNKMLKNLNNSLISSSQNQNNSEFKDSLSNFYDTHADFSASDAETDFHFAEDSQCPEDIERRSVNMLNLSNTVKRPLQMEAEACEPKRLKVSQITPSVAEPDIRFLEALLPDMALMNTRQKIIFKRKIYQTLEEVFENSNDFPNLNSVNEPPTKINNNNNMSQTMITTISSNPNQNAAHSNNVMNNLGNNQVKQTVLTVNSSVARNLINNIANLSEADLQRVHGFLHANVRTTSNNNSGMNNPNNNQMNNLNQNSTQRMTNGGPMPPSSAAARLMHSTPKITITKVTCPPPASLRNIAVNKPASPTTATVSTTIHHTPGPIMTPNVHSTTTTMTATPSTATNNNNTGTNSNTNTWNHLAPIAIKDEIEDVDID